MMRENKYLVKKVSVMDTFRNLPVGEPVTFDCREAGPYGSAISAVSRLNAAAKTDAYKVSTEDNGATYTVLRLK